MTPFHHLDPATPPADAALIWPWRPNWATLPVERLEWRTAVHVAQNGREQRRALRPEPRLQMTYSYLLAEDDAPVALSLMRAWQGKVWAAPVWWAASKLTVGAPTDVLALSRATATLWQAGSRGMVYAGPGSLETFVVDSVTTSGLVLTETLAGTWPAGATVVPLHFADLPSSQSVSAPAGELLRLDVTFEVRPGLTPVLAEPADGSAWGDTFPTGTAATDPRDHLLGLEHNWAEEAKLTVSFPNDVNDPGLGLLTKRPAGARAAMQWSVRMLLEGDAAVAQLRQFVAAHRARAVGFYALNPVLDTDAASVVAGVADMPSLRFYDSPEFYFAGLSYIFGGERKNLRAEFSGSDITVAESDTGTIYRPRMVSYARLASDAVEITHHSLGVAEVTLPVTTQIDDYLYRTMVTVAEYTFEGGAHTATAHLGASVGWRIDRFDFSTLTNLGAVDEVVDVVGPWLTPREYSLAEVPADAVLYSDALSKSYAVHATLISGALTSGNLDNWITITTGVNWFVGVGGSTGEMVTGTVLLELSEVVEGSPVGPILASGIYTMTSIAE